MYIAIYTYISGGGGVQVVGRPYRRTNVDEGEVNTRVYRERAPTKKKKKGAAAGLLEICEL